MIYPGSIQCVALYILLSQFMSYNYKLFVLGRYINTTLRLQMSAWLGYGQLKNVSLDVRTYTL